MDARKIIQSLLIISMGVVPQSCHHVQPSTEFEAFVGSSIKLPQQLKRIYNYSIDDVELSTQNVRQLIIYADSATCGTCWITKLTKYTPLFEDHKYYEAFNTLMIIAPSTSDKQRVIDVATEYNYPFPIYLDETNALKELNPYIPDDEMFHTFLIDANGRVLLVGDPITNPGINDLLLKQILLTNNH